MSLVAFGCTDTVGDTVAPATASNDVEMSGYVSASLWQPGSAGFVHAGTVSSYAEVTLAGENVITHVGPATVTEQPGSTTESLSIPVHTLGSPDQVELLDVLAAASGAGTAIRLDLGGPTFSHQTADGKELRMQLSRGDDGRPPGATAIYVDDELKSLNLVTYRRAGSSWAPASMTTVHFDANGGVVSVMKHDVSGVGKDPGSP